MSVKVLELREVIANVVDPTVYKIQSRDYTVNTIKDVSDSAKVNDKIADNHIIIKAEKGRVVFTKGMPLTNELLDSFVTGAIVDYLVYKLIKNK